MLLKASRRAIIRLPVTAKYLSWYRVQLIIPAYNTVANRLAAVAPAPTQGAFLLFLFWPPGRGVRREGGLLS